jgi:hypothetical protein
MSAGNDLNENKVNREPADKIGSALSALYERGERFIVPWRLKPNATQTSCQEGDASCGSGPVD